MKAYHSINRKLPSLAIALLPLGVWAQGGLHTSPGIHLVVSGAPSIVLHDAALINEGALSPGNSTFVFTGNAPSKTAFIGGGPLSFYRLTIDKAQGNLQLDNNIAVTGILSMTKGNLELNNHSIDLATTGSIAGERNESRITGIYGGTVKATALLNAPQSVNPGNIGVEITSAAYMGLTTITRGHTPQSNATGETGIQRYFDIAPSANTNLHASLRFYYFDDELAGNDKDALSLFATRNGQQDWILSGRDNANGIAGWVVKSDINQLNRFTLAIGKEAPARSLLKASALAWPNPSRDGFTLSLFSNTEKEFIISLYDQQGRLMEAKRLHCLAGNNQLQWDISRYAAATYYLRFNQPGIKNIAIVKQ